MTFSSAASLVNSLRCLMSTSSGSGRKILSAHILRATETFTPSAELLGSGVLSTMGVASRGFQTTSQSLGKSNSKSPGEAMDQPKKWTAYNKVLLPPQQPTESRRPAQVFHQRTMIRGSNLRMWYAAQAIRGMSIDDALDYCRFSNFKGTLVRESWYEIVELMLFY